MALYREPAVEGPTLDQLRDVGSKLGYTFEVDELKSYHDYVKLIIAAYTVVDSYSEPTPEVAYPRTPGTVPDPSENEYNAWYVKVDIPGAPKGKLKGKKVAIKDSIQMAGVQMGNGSKLVEGYTPEWDATVVTRVLDEGATITGRGNCEDMCVGNSSFTCAFGPVLNFYDKTRSAGGSSSGCAVLVANGDVDMAIGTDTGGSIRVPCAWNGIVGMKPTYGLVPVTGNMMIEPILDHLGPMTRTVQDCALLLEAIAGYDELDGRQCPSTTSQPYTTMVSHDLTGMKIGILTEGFEGAEPDVDSVVRTTVNNLSKCGATVEEVSIPIFKDAATLFLPMAMIGAYQNLYDQSAAVMGLKAFQQTSLVDLYSRTIKERGNDMCKNMKVGFMVGRYLKDNYGFHYYQKATNVLRRVKQAFDEAFENYDVLALPTVKFKPPLLPTGEITPFDYIAQCWAPIENTNAFDSSGHPALTINAGFSEGLPVGVMFAAKYFDEGSLLKVGRAVEVTCPLPPAEKTRAEKKPAEVPAAAPAEAPAKAPSRIAVWRK